MWAKLRGFLACINPEQENLGVTKGERQHTHIQTPRLINIANHKAPTLALSKIPVRIAHENLGRAPTIQTNCGL